MRWRDAPATTLRLHPMRIPRYLALILLVSACASQASDDQPASTTLEETPVAPTAISPPGDHVQVIQIFDGDSLIAALDDGTHVEVRLLGINAPEGSECHGDAAKRTLEQLLDSGTATLVEDIEATDQFDRLLRYIYVDGLNVNMAMIANGDAIVLQGDHSFDAEFAAIADSAADSAIGMWAPDVCGPDLPPDSIAIVDFFYNPAGRDEDDLNGEWIAVANDGSQAVNLSDWTLRDESTQNRYRFPESFFLESGGEVLVHSGCGSDTTTDLFWCAEDPVWSNGGDTAILQLPTGAVVSRERYDGDF